MSFSLNTDTDDCPIVANTAASSIVEEDILFSTYSKVIVSDGELLEKVKDAIQGVNDAKNRLLLELYYDLQLQCHVRREYRAYGGELKSEWRGVTPENQLVFSRGTQMLIYEGLDRALFNRIFYPFTMNGDKQPPYEEEFNISDEDRVNNVILKWREYCTNSTDFMIPLTPLAKF
jgi:hypothetical protein